METDGFTADDQAPVHAPEPRTAMGLVAIVMSVEGVYGLIVVAGLIVVSRNLTGSSAEAWLSVIATLLVFFAAHVYAVAASWLAGDGREQGLWAAVQHGVRHSIAMLLAGAIPVIILALGVIGLLGSADAVWVALAADIVLLGLLGWFIAAARAQTLLVRLGSMMLTAAFGGILIVLKALVHH